MDEYTFSRTKYDASQLNKHVQITLLDIVFDQKSIKLLSNQSKREVSATELEIRSSYPRMVKYDSECC